MQDPSTGSSRCAHRSASQQRALASGWGWPRGALEGGRLEGRRRVKSEYFPTRQVTYSCICLNPPLKVAAPAGQPCAQSSTVLGPSSGSFPTASGLGVVSTPTVDMVTTGQPSSAGQSGDGYRWAQRVHEQGCLAHLSALFPSALFPSHWPYV